MHRFISFFSKFINIFTDCIMLYVKLMKKHRRIYQFIINFISSSNLTISFKIRFSSPVKFPKMYHDTYQGFS